MFAVVFLRRDGDHALLMMSPSAIVQVLRAQVGKAIRRKLRVLMYRQKRSDFNSSGSNTCAAMLDVSTECRIREHGYFWTGLKLPVSSKTKKRIRK